jgi:glycosyltransferase A (GT-A) superfamily protein (DUF2064 family)
MRRYVVLFAREPSREARAKGFAHPDGAELFAAFARGWTAAARRVGAQLAVASPSEDRAGWNRWLSASEEPLWLPQLGESFGERLEKAARAALDLGGQAVLVGGDVVPCPQTLDAAFRLLEGGADAVVAPARDGGFSMVSLRSDDLDLLRDVVPRRRDACARLCQSLVGRGRIIERLPFASDVDRRRDMRTILRSAPITGELRDVVRRALGRPRNFALPKDASPPPCPPNYSPGLRAPPTLVSH